MRQIVDTAAFPEFQPAPSAEVTPEMVWMLVVLGLLIALIVGFFVYRSVVNRRDKAREARDGGPPRHVPPVEARP